jgi:hypothetical protein
MGDLAARVESTGPSLVHGQNRQLSMDTSGNARVTQGTLGAGERRTDSATESYQVVRQEANLTIVSTTSAVTIGGGVANDTHLMGVQFMVALTGTCVITGFADETGAAKSLTFPAAAPAGFYNFFGAKNAAGALTVTCSNAAEDDDVAIFWRPA